MSCCCRDDPAGDDFSAAGRGVSVPSAVFRPGRVSHKHPAAAAATAAVPAVPASADVRAAAAAASVPPAELRAPRGRRERPEGSPAARAPPQPLLQESEDRIGAGEGELVHARGELGRRPGGGEDP